MRTKLSLFFKNINKIGIEQNSSIRFDMSKLLLEYETVLGAHVILEETQKISNEGKKLIRSRTKSELDYYFELLRIYYVNYKNSKKTFRDNNTKLKDDCMTFIKDNDIKILYKNGNTGGGKGVKGGKCGKGGKGGKGCFGQSEHIPKFEEDTDEENSDEETDKEKKEEKKEEKQDDHTEETKEEDEHMKDPNAKQPHASAQSQNVLEQNRFAIVPYDLTIKYKERIHRASDVWTKMFRIISLYTHPDKTDKEILHNLFRKVVRHYESGDNYYLIFIIKILGIDGSLTKKYKNFMKKHKKKYEAYIDELNNRISYLWNARMYYVKCPVYNYTKMDEPHKDKLVKFCLTNNMLEFNQYSKYTS
jgi:hypothetical protein